MKISKLQSKKSETFPEKLDVIGQSMAFPPHHRTKVAAKISAVWKLLLLKDLLDPFTKARIKIAQARGFFLENREENRTQNVFDVCNRIRWSYLKVRGSKSKFWKYPNRIGQTIAKKTNRFLPFFETQHGGDRPKQKNWFLNENLVSQKDNTHFVFKTKTSLTQMLK